MDKIDIAIVELSEAYESQGSPSVGFGVAASPELIKAIEKMLKVTFPVDYIDFLKRYGGIEIGDSYFFGTWSTLEDDDLGTTVLGETISLRDEHSLPHDLVPFFKSGHASYVCMNCSVVPNQHPVVYFSSITGDVMPAISTNSFSDFLLNFLKNMKEEIS